MKSVIKGYNGDTWNDCFDNPLYQTERYHSESVTCMSDLVSTRVALDQCSFVNYFKMGQSDIFKMLPIFSQNNTQDFAET